MNQDFSELIRYLDKKFANIDGKLDNLQDKKADKSDVNELMTAINYSPGFAEKIKIGPFFINWVFDLKEFKWSGPDGVQEENLIFLSF